MADKPIYHRKFENHCNVPKRIWQSNITEYSIALTSSIALNFLKLRLTCQSDILVFHGCHRFFTCSSNFLCPKFLDWATLKKLDTERPLWHYIWYSYANTLWNLCQYFTHFSGIYRPTINQKNLNLLISKVDYDIWFWLCMGTFVYILLLNLLFRLVASKVATKPLAVKLS